MKRIIFFVWAMFQVLVHAASSEEIVCLLTYNKPEDSMQRVKCKELRIDKGFIDLNQKASQLHLKNKLGRKENDLTLDENIYFNLESGNYFLRNENIASPSEINGFSIPNKNLVTYYDSKKNFIQYGCQWDGVEIDVLNIKSCNLCSGNATCNLGNGQFSTTLICPAEKQDKVVTCPTASNCFFSKNNLFREVELLDLKATDGNSNETNEKSIQR